MSKHLRNNILKHTALWLVYFILPLIIVPRTEANYIERSQVVLLSYFFTHLYSIIFFYVNFFWAIPNLAYKNKKWKYFLVVLSFVLTCFAVFEIISVEFNYENEKIPLFQLFAAVLKLLFVAIVAWVLFLYKRNQEQLIAKNQAELAYLKAQVNPHFLFNVLNSLYALAIKKSDKLVDAIPKISDMMRYNIEEAQKAFVSLDQELEYIQDYIEIQKLRLTTKTKISYTIEGDTSNKQIEPLLLIAFIENAFKYGVSTEKESEIVVNIEISEQTLKLYIQNDKLRILSNTSGTGIKNTIKRLDHTYHNRYVLDIDDEENSYKVQLLIHI